MLLFSENEKISYKKSFNLINKNIIFLKILLRTIVYKVNPTPFYLVISI